MTVTPDGQIFVATREGAFHSADSGQSWNHVVAGLPDKDITSVTYDGSHKRLLATSGQTGVVFESSRWWQHLAAWTGFRLPSAPHQRGARALRWRRLRLTV